MRISNHPFVPAASCMLVFCLLTGCGTRPAGSTQADKSQSSDSVAADSTDENAVDTGEIAIADFDWKFSDIHGTSHDPFADPATKAMVLVFITTDCPIANYYQPTLARMTDEFAARDVPFFLCHSDPDTEMTTAIQHAKDFQTKAAVLLDNNQAIAKHVDAKMTPEAFLINREGETLYRGRIDDLYADYGKRRSAPKTHDLRDAIEAFIAGETIPSNVTRAVGCYIPYPKPQDSAASTGSTDE